MKGFRRRTAQSGFTVLRIHYSADPAKDPDNFEGMEWYENELRGYPGGKTSAAWRQEMEIDWDAAGGELVFPQLENHRDKIICKPFEVPESWGLYASYDYGHRNPAAFLVHAIDHDGDLWTVWEFYKAGLGYRQQSMAIRNCPYYPRLAYLPIADPSIWAQNQQTESDVKSIAQLFFELPESEQVIFIPGQAGGDITVAERINGDLWYDLGTKKPRWRIFNTCPKLIWELERLRYQEWSGTQQEMKNLREQIVDKDNHAWDATKMFLMHFFSSPVVPKEDPLEHLKHEDFRSYQEWKSVREMYDRYEGKNESIMGNWD